MKKNNGSRKDGSGKQDLLKSPEPEKYFVPDTSALEHAEKVFEELREQGRNCITMPFATWEELDSHKTGDDFKGLIARHIIRSAVDLLRAKDKSFMFFPPDLNLSKYGGLKNEKKDHQIIATALNLQRKFPNKPVILVTQDTNMEGLALHFGLKVQPVKSGQIDKPWKPEERKTIFLQEEWIVGNIFSAEVPDEKIATVLKGVKENEGIICYKNVDGECSAIGAAVRKGGYFRIIENDIKLFGVPSKSNNGKPNWGQHIAMQLLRDKDVSLVALTGPAGTSKTFLSLLAAFEQISDYRQVLISRATIQLGNKDRLGFNPGKFGEKMRPWMLPIYDNIKVIKELVGKEMAKKIDGWFAKDKIEILDLDKIRGRTLPNCFIIIDESQNLSSEHGKAIATRGGEGAKVVFTGDFSRDQIDVPWLNEKSNSLSVMSANMSKSDLFARIYLDQAIRSKLTQEILEYW